MNRILIVDDDPTMCTMLATILGKRGFEVTTHGTADAAFTHLRTSDVDVVVTDINMKGENGLELCQRIVADRPDVPVVVITAFGSLDTAIGAIRAGAYDFVPKPFEVAALIVSLDRAIQHRALREEVKRLRQAVGSAPQFGNLLGDSDAMRRVFELLERMRDSDASLVVTGESGTGKELVARAIHERSRRAAGPFVPINCAALPEALLESELFGHVRGAFTDARSSRTGLFVQANGGTLFLDEIGELPLALQAKLLRALQERKVRPIGGDTEIELDVRIVVATNRDLEEAVKEHRFREDLYYRINVVHLELPPLRVRGNDVLLLAHHFVQRAGTTARKHVTGISTAAAQKLVAYSWPGNVRELQNCIERAVALTEYAEITVSDLPDRVRDHQPSRLVLTSDAPDDLIPMDEVERRYIERVLAAVGGNKKEAARILGFDRTTLYRKLERYGKSPVE